MNKAALLIMKLQEMITMKLPKELPILSLVNYVLLPGAPMAIKITSPENKSLINEALVQGINIIGVVPYKNDPENLKIGDIGTVALLVKISSTKIPQNSTNIFVVGMSRFEVKTLTSSTPYPIAEVAVAPLVKADSELPERDNTILQSLRKIAVPLVNNIDMLPAPFLFTFKKVIDNFPSSYLIDVCVSALNPSFEDKLEILKALDINERIQKGIPLISRLLGLNDMKKTLDKNILNSMPSLKIIKHPFSRKDGLEFEDKDLTELQKRLKEAKLPEYATKVVERDFNRLKRMSPFSPDNTVVRNYLDLVADLPWSISSEEIIDIQKAKQKLDADHYGMEKLKKRVIEYLAVRQLKTKLKGPILCFIGSPGVGKTSIGRSIANILNRKFQRISLGGISDQAGIRGHRRTYIGAMPGSIIQAIKSAGTNNPLIILDEIDKVGKGGYHGSPQAALLEVLDPEQNTNFTDHYLNMPFDLSQVTFIATANSADTIPAPLLDRMEVIRVSGYTVEEKFHIASRHLLPKQLDVHGLSASILHITDEAIYTIVSAYTKEAGVRSLDRKLASVCRWAAVKVAEESYQSLPLIVESQTLDDILGIAQYVEDDQGKALCQPGVAIGLAWSTTGGSLITVEVTRILGKSGNLILTGSLGSVMKESAQIALNWARSVAQQYGIAEGDSAMIMDSGIHIHFPAGAVSKEGPSAGVTIATALMSVFAGIPVTPGLAMTGELTLQGRVLPVGGIKEKILAAHRTGINKVIMPRKSKKYLADIPENVLNCIEITLVENMTEVIEAAFNGELIPRSNQSLLFSKL